jgi:hypothetical protein
LHGACSGAKLFLTLLQFGGITNMRIFAVLAIWTLAITSAMAQRNAPDDRDDAQRLFDAFRDRMERELREELGQQDPDEPKASGQGGVIGFEDIAPAAGSNATTGVPLTDQYRKVHGVSFGKGASVHVCGASDNYTAAARIVRACPYPRAASGQRAALFDVRAGGRALQIGFDQAIQSLAMRINPTGGRVDEEFIARAVAFDANGARVATQSVRFIWDQGALSWPTTISLRDDKTGQSFTRVTIELLRAAENNQPVRFLIDDLIYENARQAANESPVARGLSALDGPPEAGRSVIVSSPRIGPMHRPLQKYRAPTRKRLEIDWDAVEADLTEQAALGIVPVRPDANSRRYANIAELPLLLPTAADPGSLRVFGNRSTVNAVWRYQGRDYAVYGSRLVTVLRPAAGAPGVRSAITFSGTDDDFTASFSLYGASYTLTQYCEGGAAADPGCYDRDALGAVAESLAVAVGAAGRGRP